MKKINQERNIINMRILYLTIILFLLLSCNKNKDQSLGDKTDINSPVSLEHEKDTNRISASNPYGKPSDKKELEKWEKEVRINGNPEYYKELVFYYDTQPNGPDKMIEFCEIMISKHRSNNQYLLAYFDYVDNSKLANKKQLMKKAIKYMEQIIQKEKKNNFFYLLTKGNLSKIYQDGIYVKQDTVISNYIDAGGINIDSIKQNRNIHIK